MWRSVWEAAMPLLPYGNIDLPYQMWCHTLYFINQKFKIRSIFSITLLVDLDEIVSHDLIMSTISSVFECGDDTIDVGVFGFLNLPEVDNGWISMHYSFFEHVVLLGEQLVIISYLSQLSILFHTSFDLLPKGVAFFHFKLQLLLILVKVGL